MANKYSRTVVGSIVKSKDTTKPDYVTVANDIVLKKGQYLNLESKTFQLSGIDKAVADGKMSAEIGTAAKERINKIPDFVRFQIVQVTKNA